MTRPARPEKGHTVSVLFLPEQVRELRCFFPQKHRVKETDQHSGTQRGPPKRPGEESLTSNLESMFPPVTHVKAVCDFLFNIHSTNKAVPLTKQIFPLTLYPWLRLR